MCSRSRKPPAPKPLPPPPLPPKPGQLAPVIDDGTGNKGAKIAALKAINSLRIPYVPPPPTPKPTLIDTLMPPTERRQILSGSAGAMSGRTTARFGF